MRQSAGGSVDGCLQAQKQGPRLLRHAKLRPSGRAGGTTESLADGKAGTENRCEVARCEISFPEGVRTVPWTQLPAAENRFSRSALARTGIQPATAWEAVRR